MRKAVFLLWFVYGAALYGANYTISGIITDKKSGETLIGATVVDKLSGKGTVTNVYGFYSLTLPEGPADVHISYVGYTPIQVRLNIKKDTTLSIKLEGSIILNEVVIKAQRETDLKGSQMSAVEIPVEQIKAIPALFGEADVIKAIQLLPGVQSGSEGTAGMYVRGGGPDENLFLLDGIPIYNITHAFGFFSAFNPDAIKNITLYKGSFPARFGGRLSSVLDIYTNNGNDKEYHGSASIGLISAKINLEGPIIKEKTTFHVSARRTYFDVLSRPFIAMYSEQKGNKDINAGYYFYDINAKITHKFSDKSRLFASYYMGNDVIYNRISEYDYTSSMRYTWGNIVGSLRWNYIIHSKLFMNITGAYTRYRSTIEVESQTKSSPFPFDTKIDYQSGIEDISARVDFDYTPNPHHNIKFGGSYVYHTFTPDVISYAVSSATDTNFGTHPIHANEILLYAEDNWEINDYLKANLGLHYSLFFVENKGYHSIQPRLSLRILANEYLSFKTGYAYMSQYIHLLSNNNISMPSDLWVPVTERIEPMNSNQVAAGAFYNLNNIVEFSIEGYYKQMNHLIEYKDGASYMFSSDNWQNKVCMGSGWSYGVEFMVQRTLGNITGWVAYTWSKTERLFDREGETLNFGKAFPAKYDRRHDISIVLSYKIKQNIDVSATWVYSTGNAFTLGLQEYEALPDTDHDYSDASPITDIESRNNYRMPAYHRLDIGINFHKKFKRGSRTINVSIYNAYNRKNPYILYRSTVSGRPALMQLSIFPILPSISYAYTF